MIAYSKSAILDLEINQVATNWSEDNFITDNQLVAIKETHKLQLFVPNIFIRIGLFILTFILVNAGLGLICLTLDSNLSSEGLLGGICLLYGVLVIFALEFIISTKKIFRAGIDDALLYLGLIYLLIGLFLLFLNNIDNDTDMLLALLALALPFIVFASIRYLDIFLTFCGFSILIFIVFLLMFKIGGIAKSIIPFVIMATSAFSYLIVVKFRNRQDLWFWRINLDIIRGLSLLVFYLAGNYFVVRELSIEMLDLQLTDGQDIPLAFIFYILTVSVPLIFIVLGLKHRNRIMLDIGLLCAVLSIATIKYYYHSEYYPYYMVFFGALLLMFIIWAIKYLKPGQYGLTSEKGKYSSLIDPEALIIAHSFSQSGTNTAGDDLEYGGGEFGGGGSGGDY